MESIIYEYVLFASFVVMYTYAALMLFTNAPEGEEYNNYLVSRKVFAATMIMWASYLVIHWHFNPRIYNPLLAYALCFCCYFPGVMLFEAAFSALITDNYPIRKRVKQIVLASVCVYVAVFANYIFVPQKFQYYVFLVFAVFLVVEMSYLSVGFFRRYRRAIRKAEDYYSDNIDIFIKWMPNCIYIAIAFGFAGAVLSFASINAVSIYMFGGTMLFTYIMISYQNYMINIKKIKGFILTDNIEEEEDKIKEAEKLSGGDRQYIEKRLTEWIAEKGFTQKGLTIEDLAIRIGTNRTYLSSFINTNYNQPFREWVGELRITYAKELLRDKRDLPSNTIAEIVGYSPNAFITIFTKTENISPTLWRNNNQTSPSKEEDSRGGIDQFWPIEPPESTDSHR